ncbi:MAG: dihydrofolate reductase family protein [Firmicutes bacterium]|nr:dihydrofolate reductase family protein [Bacillota bacterium]
MRKKVLYIAATLDGYIADSNDGFSFLSPYDGLESVAQSYQSLLSRIDTIIMGRKTYDVIQKMGQWPYQEMKSYVMTSHPEKDLDKIFFRSDIQKLIHELDQKSGKDIWIVGGGTLISSMLELHMIDEFQIAFVPILLGSGKPLFPQANYMENLDFVKMENLDGLILLTYRKK